MSETARNTHAKGRFGHLRGTQHLRVGLAIGARAPRITSVWVVEQPAVQHAGLLAPLVARIDVEGRVVLVEALDDPREHRRSKHRNREHARVEREVGIVYVSVPFVEAGELRDVRIRVADFEGVTVARDPAALSRAFDEPPPGMRMLATVTTADIERHPEWEAVARPLGFEAPPGRFEIRRGEDGRYYWCLRRRDGRILACSVLGYEQREACEQDLRWVRDRTSACGVVSLGVTEDDGPHDPTP